MLPVYFYSHIAIKCFYFIESIKFAWAIISIYKKLIVHLSMKLY